MGFLTSASTSPWTAAVDHQEGIADDETHAFFTRLMDEGGGDAVRPRHYEMMESYWPAVARGDEEAPPAMREWAVKLEANLCMSGGYGPVVNKDSLAGDTVVAHLDLDSEAQTAVVRFRPRSLLGAMWLQLARTIEGNLQYRQCKCAACRAWFVLSPEGAGKRQHAQFCSDRCRLREWRAASQRTIRQKKTSRGAAEHDSAEPNVGWTG